MTKRQEPVPDEEQQQSERRRIASLLDTSSHEKARPLDSPELSVEEAEELEEDEESETEEAESVDDEPDEREDQEDGAWSHVNVELEKFMKSESGKAGLFFTVLAIIGLVALVTFPLFNQAGESGEGESFTYGDFNEKGEQQFNSDFDKYYLKSAKMGMYSLVFILLCGLALLVHSRTELLLNVLNAALGSEGVGLEADERLSLRLIAASVLLIPSTFVAVVGARFEGFVLLASQGNEFTNRPDGSPAGVVLLILGMILIMAIMYYIYLTLPEFMSLIERKKKTYDYLRSCQHFCEMVFFLSMVALITLPLMPALKIRATEEEGGNRYEVEHSLSDGYTGVETYDEMGEFNKIHKDFGAMKFMLNLMIFVSVLSFAGTLLFPFRLREDLTHVLISFIALALLAALLILVIYLLMLGHGGKLEDALVELSSPDITEAEVAASYNVVPFVVSVAILGISSKFIFDIYNTSILPLLRQ